MEFLQAVGVVVVKVGVGVGIIHSRVVHIGTCPHVPFNKEVDAAELATRGHALVYRIRGSIGRGVGVNIQEVAHLNIRPTRHCMYESAWVMIGIDDAVHGSVGVAHALFGMLTPTFVDYHPGTDTGMLTSGIDEHFVLMVEVLHSIVDIAYCSASTSRWHILPDNQPVPVAPLEPKVVLQFDVFAHHIHAKVFHDLQVINHCFVGRGSEEAVGPPALVERTVHIKGLVVEEHSRMSVHHSAGELPHAKVSANLVRLLSPLVCFNLQIVEVRLVGAP